MLQASEATASFVSEMCENLLTLPNFCLAVSPRECLAIYSKNVHGLLSGFSDCCHDHSGGILHCRLGLMHQSASIEQNRKQAQMTMGQHLPS